VFPIYYSILLSRKGIMGHIPAWTRLSSPVQNTQTGGSGIHPISYSTGNQYPFLRDEAAVP